MTTSPVMTVTDELIEQLEALTCIDEGGAVLIHTDQVRCLLSELRRLRAEYAELAKDAGRYRWLRDGAGYYDTRDIPGMAPQRMDEYIDTAMAAQ